MQTPAPHDVALAALLEVPDEDGGGEVSFLAVAKAMSICEGITRSEKLVLLALAERHNKDTGRCDPSLRRIAKDCISSERTIGRLLESLRSKGFIDIAHRLADNGRQRTNGYVLLFCGGEVDVVTPYEGDAVTPLEPGRETRKENLPVGAPAGAEPVLTLTHHDDGPYFTEHVARFLKAEKPQEQIAAFVDMERSLGLKASEGGRVAALVRQFGHGMHVVEALIGCEMAHGNRYDLMQKRLAGEKARQGSRRGGRTIAADESAESIRKRW